MVIMHTSTVLQHWTVVKTILKHIPTLDPLAIVLNADLYYTEKDKNVVSFITLKRFGSIRELGTVFTDYLYREKGYASYLIQSMLAKQTDPVYVLCEEKLKPFYEKNGFSEYTRCHWIVRTRRKLFNIFLKPLTGYKIVSLYIPGKNPIH